VRVDRTLPREEFFYRQLVSSADFLKAYHASAHSVDDNGLSPGHPAFGIGRRQVGSARRGLVPKQVIQFDIVVKLLSYFYPLVFIKIRFNILDTSFQTYIFSNKIKSFSILMYDENIFY